MDLDSLTTTNFPNWEAILSSACICADSLWPLNENTTSTGPISNADKQKWLSSIRKSIHKLVPDYLKIKLPMVALTHTPAAIVTTLCNLMVDLSETAQRRLEAEGKLIKFKKGQKIFTYIDAHRTLRLLIVQSTYLNIVNEHKSVLFPSMAWMCCQYIERQPKKST